MDPDLDRDRRTRANNRPTAPSGLHGAVEPSAGRAAGTASESLVSVACGVPVSARPGQTITLTYTLNATSPIVVGLGAGLYDTAGDDHSNGDGDVDEAPFAAGGSATTRPFTVPAGLAPGTYELVAEVWPANHIGQGRPAPKDRAGR